MKFMLLVSWDAERMNAEEEPKPGEREEESFPWLDDLQARGVWVTGDRLAAPRRARTVRVRGGKKLVTDGPFAETKEILGGYYLIDVPDLDAALKWAAKMPNITYGSVEVRPIMEIPEQPAQA